MVCPANVLRGTIIIVFGSHLESDPRPRQMHCSASMTAQSADQPPISEGTAIANLKKERDELSKCNTAQQSDTLPSQHPMRHEGQQDATPHSIDSHGTLLAVLYILSSWSMALSICDCFCIFTVHGHIRTIYNAIAESFCGFFHQWTQVL